MTVEELSLKTCCGIVLFNPDIKKLKTNIDVLFNQVNKILLIDNNSINQDAILCMLKEYDKTRIEYIKNDDNYGIAKALNQILLYADNNGYEWYLTMDQDSICSKTLMNEYSKEIDKVDNIAIISPFVLNNNKILYDDYIKLELPEYEIVTQPIDCITSASLNNTAKSKEVGGYFDDLFIDCVDIEFNIRILKKGYNIVKVNSAYMFQSMGDGRVVHFIKFLYKLTKKDIFKHLQVTPVYGDTRLYYISRNSKYLRDKYGDFAGVRMSKKWMTCQFIYYCLTYPISRSRIKMLKTIRQGIQDSLKIGV